RGGITKGRITMYRVLEALRQPEETNEALATRLGIEVNRRADTGKVDQTDLSRTFSDKGFRRVCAGLRAWAKANGEEWLRMLASSREGALWDEYKDLLYISEDFWRPAHDRLRAMWDAGELNELPADIQFRDRLAGESWVVTGEPSVIDNARDRELCALRIRLNQQFVFWLPSSEGRMIAGRILGELRFTEILTEDHIERGVRFVLGPDTLGAMPPFSVSSPHGEHPIAMTGMRTDASNIRLMALPESMTTRTVTWMRGVYIDLARTGAATTPDGFRWRMLAPKDLASA
ncbi:MAG: hypothetical protein ACF8QF_11210, partial [Phycisphaerales bacterium]